MAEVPSFTVVIDNFHYHIDLMVFVTHPGLEFVIVKMTTLDLELAI